METRVNDVQSLCDKRRQSLRRRISPPRRPVQAVQPEPVNTTTTSSPTFFIPSSPDLSLKTLRSTPSLVDSRQSPPVADEERRKWRPSLKTKVSKFCSDKEHSLFYCNGKCLDSYKIFRECSGWIAQMAFDCILGQVPGYYDGVMTLVYIVADCDLLTKVMWSFWAHVQLGSVSTASAHQHQPCGLIYPRNWKAGTLADIVLNKALRHGFMIVLTCNRHLWELCLRCFVNSRIDWLMD